MPQGESSLQPHHAQRDAAGQPADEVHNCQAMPALRELFRARSRPLEGV